MQTRTVYSLVTLSALFWGMNFVLAAPLLADEPPLWSAALRFIGGAAIMLILASWRKEPLLAAARENFRIYLLLGGIGIAAFNLLFFLAMQRTSATNGALIMATNPLLTTILAMLVLGERATRRQLAAIPLALIGVGVVVSGGHLEKLGTLHVSSGDLLMLAANLAWAIYNVLNRRHLTRGTALANTTLLMLAGALILLILAIASGEVAVIPGLRASGALLTMTICGTVLAYLFWTAGIGQLGAARTALFLNLVPVFAMLVGMLGGTLPSMPQLIGGALVIGGVSLASIPSRRRQDLSTCNS